MAKSLQEQLCPTCHGMDTKIVGPALTDVAKKYAARPDVVEYLTQKIRAGGAGVWGPIPRPRPRPFPSGWPNAPSADYPEEVGATPHGYAPVGMLGGLLDDFDQA